MLKKYINIVIVVAVVFGCVAGAQADIVYSIYDLQYTTNASGDSPYNGQIVNCSGGVVMQKYVGGKTRLTIYDKNSPNNWGGIFAATFGNEFDNIQVGDVVSLANMEVEESRGNTQLFWTQNAVVTKNGTDTLPGPIMVHPSDIVNPKNGALSEKYEAMYLQVQNVNVTALDLGKADDNYSLNGNGICWATDYYNKGRLPTDKYHPKVQLGSHLDSVSGILEQYTKTSAGWDYYQLGTTQYCDVVPEPATVGLLLLGGGCLVRRKRKVGP
ncbi:MAG: PEP-CTERM sorting domain-containing protein [Planctomycetes bacterium]|nr:PEP-CTERM sorting domain-containing protein [Planctomycetota bacterium]